MMPWKMAGHHAAIDAVLRSDLINLFQIAMKCNGMERNRTGAVMHGMGREQMRYVSA